MPGALGCDPAISLGLLQQFFPELQIRLVGGKALQLHRPFQIFCQQLHRNVVRVLLSPRRVGEHSTVRKDERSSDGTRRRSSFNGFAIVLADRDRTLCVHEAGGHQEAMTAMVQARPNYTAMDLMHCRAICHEIGERLRLALDRDRSPAPPHLRELLDRFEEEDARARLQWTAGKGR